MDLLIVTGLSGAGKSRAIDALEDIGFYCIDNMPPTLISKFAEICLKSDDDIDRVAIVTDIRGGDFFKGLFDELKLLEQHEVKYKLLFLDASDQVLMHRYKETRRTHPISKEQSCSTQQAIKLERELLRPAREKADYIIDTSLMSSAQLKERISKTFLDKISNQMQITCASFGFKYGPATEADLVFDVRCLKNPFYVDELKKKTGLDQDVRDYVMDAPESKELLKKIIDMVDFLIELYLNEGKSQLVIAFGCTGGKHRSVTFAEYLYKHLLESGKKTMVNHRDIYKINY